MNFEKERGSFAGTWIVIIVMTFITMLTYSIFYGLIAGDLYSLVQEYDGNIQTAGLIVTFFKIFPYPFLTSLMLWGMMSSFRKSSQDERRY